MSGAFIPLFAIVAFFAVVLFVEALYMIWNAYKGPDAKKIEQRLRALSAGADASVQSAQLKNRMLSDVPTIERLMLQVPRAHSLDRVLLQSGLDWTVAKLLSLSMLAGMAVYVAITLADLREQWLFAVVIVASCLPWMFVQWRRRRRLRKMERQLPEALDLIGRALRAGHALPSCLKMVGEECFDPIATEFRITHDELNYGVAIQQALNNLADRSPITDIRYLVVAILIQREAGGNLTEVLDNISKLIRNRLKFQAQVRVLTTEGRMSAWVLGLMPFALAALLNFANHEFISVLWTDPVGKQITNVVLAMMAIGGLWLYKLVRIRV